MTFSAKISDFFPKMFSVDFLFGLLYFLPVSLDKTAVKTK